MEWPLVAQSRRPSTNGLNSRNGRCELQWLRGLHRRCRICQPSFVLGSQQGAQTVAEQAKAEEARIKALLEGWADAVRRHDLPAILAHHDRDIVMFDLPPPLQCRGIEAYEQTWDLLFRYHKPGTAFDFRELAVTAGADVAFAVVILWCGPDLSSNPIDKDGFLFRLTVGLRKADGDWASHTSIILCLLRTDRSESVHCVGSLGAQRPATPAGQCPLTRRVCMSASAQSGRWPKLSCALGRPATTP